MERVFHRLRARSMTALVSAFLDSNSVKYIYALLFFKIHVSLKK
jgi:hypothetical protein